MASIFSCFSFLVNFSGTRTIWPNYCNILHFNMLDINPSFPITFDFFSEFSSLFTQLNFSDELRINHLVFHYNQLERNHNQKERSLSSFLLQHFDIRNKMLSRKTKSQKNTHSLSPLTQKWYIVHFVWTHTHTSSKCIRKVRKGLAQT